MSVTDDEFRSVMRSWASGVTIITTPSPSGHHGMTASSFTSVSLEPPLVSVCVDGNAQTLQWLRASRRFAINVLATGQADLSNRFAARDEADRFDDLAFTVGAGGAALLEDVSAQLECEVFALHEAGDHVIVVGSVDACRGFERSPLLYCAGGYGTFTSVDG
jgi:flavin reductase (DIM6/NTAB) family NADH-FMN oxidoreductase RutF